MKIQLHRTEWMHLHKYHILASYISRRHHPCQELIKYKLIVMKMLTATRSWPHSSPLVAFPFGGKRII